MKVTELTQAERVVYGNNLINELSTQAVKKILPQLDKFLNKKISTVNNDKTKAFQVELLTVPFNAENGQSYRSYLKIEHGRLTLFNDVTVKDKDYETGGYGCSYYKKDIDLGYVQNGILTIINNFDTICAYENLNIKYDAKEQKQIKEQIEQLETQIKILKSKLC